MIHYNCCPICKSLAIHSSFTAKDYTVSNKLFGVWQCNDCYGMFTQDVPSMEKIGGYYQSENYISHSNTRKGLINRLYHLVRKYTIARKRKLIRNETGLTKGNILDVGCGTGVFLHSMHETGWTTTGLEPDVNARLKASEIFNINVLPSPELFNLKHSSFDAITLWHVLEHVHSLHEYVMQLKKLITQRGLIFIAVPNFTSYDASRYKQEWAGYDVPRHLYHFSPKSMNTLVKIHGMQIQKTIPMWFDSYYVSMLSERNRRGGIINAFFTGILSTIYSIADKKRCSSMIYIISKI